MTVLSYMLRRSDFATKRIFVPNLWEKTFGYRAFGILELRMGNVNCIITNSFHSNQRDVREGADKAIPTFSPLARKGSDVG